MSYDQERKDRKKFLRIAISMLLGMTLLATGIVVATSYAQDIISTQRAKQILAVLIAKNDITYQVNLEITDKKIVLPDGNLATTTSLYVAPSRYGHTIYMSVNMLMFFNGNENWMAAALGHELAHVVAGDSTRNSERDLYCKDNSLVCEKEADLLGQKFMAAAGFNPCELSSYWVQYKNVFGSKRVAEGVQYPSVDETIIYTSCNKGK